MNCPQCGATVHASGGASSTPLPEDDTNARARLVVLMRDKEREIRADERKRVVAKIKEHMLRHDPHDQGGPAYVHEILDKLESEG